MIRGDPYQLFWEFIRKKNINFQKTKIILTSTFHRELKDYFLVGISRKKLLFDTSFEGYMNIRGDPYQLYSKFIGKKKY